jgi:hypothetical protein
VKGDHRGTSIAGKQVPAWEEHLLTASSAHTPTGTTRPLAEAIAALAGTPDDVPGIDDQLQRTAQLAADRIAAVDYAAVSTRSGDGGCTVATSGELAAAVTDATGPARNGALPPPPAGTGTGTGTTMDWPGFREMAAEMGMGVVSVPLFAGSGASIATLDLYGRDAAGMAPLTVGVCAAYDPDLEMPTSHGELPPLDGGGEELVAGFAEALAVRATIQLALAMVEDGAGDPYLNLRLRAVDQGVPLLDAATAVIQRLPWGPWPGAAN